MKNIIGFVFGLLVCLIFVEAYVSNSFMMNRFINDYDPEVGRIRKANAIYVKFEEGFGIGKVNNFNYLNKEYPINKSEENIRIALIGDSYVESFQVFDRNYFGRIMENILNEKLNKPVEVLNFGRSGFNIGHCYVYYNTFVKKFNPDYVLYILGSNDFTTVSVEPLLPIVKLDNQSLGIEKPYINSDYLKKYEKMIPLLSISVLFNNLNTGRKLLKKDYMLPKLFDKFYVSKIENQETDEVDQKNKIEISPKIGLILDFLQEEKGYFFLRSDVEVVNTKQTFCNISHIFKNKDYNPHEWKITKTTGHWNNMAHRDIGEYMAEEMEKIIRKEQGLTTNKH